VRTIASVSIPSNDDLMRLVLIRHGESNVTVNRTIGGFRTCTGLSPLGREQVGRLRHRLETSGELRADVLIASNFVRAIETAEILASVFGDISVGIDDGFGEHDPGPDIDGMSFDEYVDRFGTPDWSGDPHQIVFPGGETTAEFHVRVADALTRTVTAYVAKTVVVSCHGGVIDAAFRLLLQTEPTGSFELHTLNTSMTEFQPATSGKAWKLTRYNDAAHLAGLPAGTPRVAQETA
jgi:probable phosphoglycerate mutase